MRTFALIEQIGNDRRVVQIYNNSSLQEAEIRIKQFANKLNCNQKIIWVDELMFKLLSSDGTTQKYMIMEKVD